MLRHAHRTAECSLTPGSDYACEHRQSSCAVILPAINNGIPTTERFSERLLPASAHRALLSCYAHSQTWVKKSMCPQHARVRGNASRCLVHGLDRALTDGPETPISPWDAHEWWRRVARDIKIFKGQHPVRYNNTCMKLNYLLTIEALPAFWHPEWPLDEAPLPTLVQASPAPLSVAPLASEASDEVEVGNEWPYFTNTIWLARTTLYTAALHQIHLIV